MPDLVVDIETVALPIDETQTAYLTRDCETEEEKQKELGKLALWPLTGRVACIGVRNAETGNGKVLIGGSEAVQLEEFWKIAAKYSRIATFNGRGFDLPFLITRSAVNGVIPSRRDLMGNRYSSFPHCDLLDQFSFYGAMRKFSMDMYCRSFGIVSPKQGGMDGSKVGELWAEGNLKAIEEYNSLDLEATCLLFNVWKRFFAKGSQ